MMAVLEILHPGATEFRGRRFLYGEAARTHLSQEQQHAMRAVELAAPVFLAGVVRSAIRSPEHGHVVRSQVLENLDVEDVGERFDVASIGVAKKEGVARLGMSRGVRSQGESHFDRFFSEEKFVECGTSDVSDVELGRLHGEKPSITGSGGEHVTKRAGS